MIYRIIVFMLFLPTVLFGQESSKKSSSDGALNNIGDCFGAIKIDPNVSSKVELIGNRGEFNDFKNVESYLEGEEMNSLWFSCEAKLPGFLSITLENAGFQFNYVAFLLNDDESCESIHDGSKAPIQKGEVNQKNILTFLMDSIEISASQSLVLCINSKTNIQSSFDLISSFADHITEQEIEAMKKVYDFRDNTSIKPFEIKIRDASTNLPLVAKVILSGARKNNAMYIASDFIFPSAEQLKMNLKIDVGGYFFEDREINSRQLEGNELIIYLEPIQLNQSIELEGIGFVSQSDVLLPFAYSKLKRLKDFMALNPSVEIQIEGHVHFNGKNTWRAKRLSKRRAKKVKAYLVDSGISKSRMTAVGYGNTRMKYPEANSDVQIQANRRVEIRIK